MKIAHFLNDNKFVDKHIKKFIDCDFENDFFYLNPKNNYSGNHKDRVVYLAPESEAYTSVVNTIETYDIVILYYLNSDKFRLVEAIKDSKVKIIWSFYGAEIYDLPSVRQQMLSERTQKALKRISYKLNFAKLRKLIGRYRNRLKKRRTKSQWMQQSFQRIDYFLWYNKYEYDLLNELMGQRLPSFMQASLNNPLNEVVPEKNKTNGILVGNSASYFNNHLDVLDLLTTNRYKGKVSLPFSYLKNDNYVPLVKNYVGRSDLAISIMDEFMTYTEYIAFINQHKAAIYPSYRQMGLGNIFIAIRCGLKIYLSDKNPTLKWLREKGMKIYSLEKDFSNDLIKNNLTLEAEFIDENNRIYGSMVSAEQDRLMFKKFSNMIK
ncbi:hypothetical protein GCM10027284_02150 [Cyclobacterium sediminis]